MMVMDGKGSGEMDEISEEDEEYSLAEEAHNYGGFKRRGVERLHSLELPDDGGEGEEKRG